MYSVEAKCEDRSGAGRAMDYTLILPAGMKYDTHTVSTSTPGLLSDVVITVKEVSGGEGENKTFTVSLNNATGMHQFTIDVTYSGGSTETHYVGKDKSAGNGRSIQITLGGSM